MNGEVVEVVGVDGVCGCDGGECEVPCESVVEAEATPKAPAKRVPNVKTPKVVTVRTVDLNTADAAVLESLPKIGPSKAQDILDDRCANGPFVTVQDLTRVKGIGEKTLARILSEPGLTLVANYEETEEEAELTALEELEEEELESENEEDESEDGEESTEEGEED